MKEVQILVTYDEDEKYWCVDVYYEGYREMSKVTSDIDTLKNLFDEAHDLINKLIGPKKELENDHSA